MHVHARLFAGLLWDFWWATVAISKPSHVTDVLLADALECLLLEENRALIAPTTACECDPTPACGLLTLTLSVQDDYPFASSGFGRSGTLFANSRPG